MADAGMDDAETCMALPEQQHWATVCEVLVLLAAAGYTFLMLGQKTPV
jgi:hypothetical protein